MSENHRNPSPSAFEASREIRKVVSRLRRRILKSSEQEDLTLSQASVLARIADRNDATAAELASSEGVRHQSMTTTVASLAALGLVTRRPDPDDGRRQLISLTAEGRRRVERGRQARTEWLAGQLQDKCTEDERQLVIAAMAVLERLTHD